MCGVTLEVTLENPFFSVSAEPEKQEELTITGITRYLQEHLAEELSLSVLAEQSGYGDYWVFTKVFKKSEGITPSQYRRDSQSDVTMKI